MTDKTKREVHGLLRNGERIYLGSVEVTDQEATDMLEGIAGTYAASGGAGWFNVKSAVYDVKAFAGVQITPAFELGT